jgi:hypothetical protein
MIEIPRRHMLTGQFRLHSEMSGASSGAFIRITCTAVANAASAPFDHLVVFGGARQKTRHVVECNSNQSQLHRINSAANRYSQRPGNGLESSRQHHCYKPECLNQICIVLKTTSSIKFIVPMKRRQKTGTCRAHPTAAAIFTGIPTS